MADERRRSPRIVADVPARLTVGTEHLRSAAPRRLPRRRARRVRAGAPSRNGGDGGDRPAARRGAGTRDRSRHPQRRVRRRPAQRRHPLRGAGAGVPHAHRPLRLGARALTSRRRFLGMGAAGAAAWSGLGRVGAAAADAPFEVEEATIDALQAAMTDGRTDRARAHAGLPRPHRAPRPQRARRCAACSRRTRTRWPSRTRSTRSGGRRGRAGPLHGVPILLKDNVDTHDRMTTTAGSLALEGSIPPRDSFVAERLRAAGAVLLGKANMSEWANIRSDKSSSGWSARGGQCRNPYVLDRNPCGSSSGSGAAVAASLCAAAVGTETDGSIVCPSNANGLVGIKPTLGLVSRAGIIPIAHSQDTAGPDGAHGPGRRDPAGRARRRRPARRRDRGQHAARRRPTTRASSTRTGCSGARIGVARKFLGFNRDVDRLFEDGARGHEGAGRRDRRPRGHPARWASTTTSELEVLLYELKADLNAYLAALGPAARVKIAGRRDRVQRGEPRARDAVLRPGAVPAGPGEGPAHGQGLPGRAGEEPPPLARGGHRRGDERSTGWTRSSRPPAARPG